MLIEFSGKTTGSVLMFGKVATDLLKMMGQSSNNEGAISAEDVPVALENLKQALGRLPENDSEEEDNPALPEVSFSRPGSDCHRCLCDTAKLLTLRVN